MTKRWPKLEALLEKLRNTKNGELQLSLAEHAVLTILLQDELDREKSK